MLSLLLRSLTHFEVAVVHEEREDPSRFSTCGYLVSHTAFVKGAIFSHWVIPTSLLKPIYSYVWELFLSRLFFLTVLYFFLWASTALYWFCLLSLIFYVIWDSLDKCQWTQDNLEVPRPKDETSQVSSPLVFFTLHWLHAVYLNPCLSKMFQILADSYHRKVIPFGREKSSGDVLQGYFKNVLTFSFLMTVTVS